MQYTEIKLDDADALDAYIESNSCEHMADMRQTNVTILGIVESYNTETIRILTDKGYLFVYIGIDDENKFVYHVYNIFKEPENTQFKHVLIINEPVDFNKTPIYENSHRLVLKKKANSKSYYAQPIYYGQENNKYVYSLDIDGFRMNAIDYNADADGLYRLSSKIGNDGVLYLLITQKQFMHFNVFPENNNIGMVFRQLNGTEANIRSYKYDYANMYVDNFYTENDPGDDEGINLSDQKFLCFSVEGNASSNIEDLPEQIVLEVY